MKNIKLTIAYDGRAYRGWQKTATGPSIEETLQHCLEKILQEKITLQAASRTDAGVHAEGQIVNFFTDRPLTSRLKTSLNSLLPKDIIVTNLEEAPENFHPTVDCIGKEYHYYLCHGSVQHPQHRFYSWHYPALLNYTLMREAGKLIIGEKDFSALCNNRKNSPYKNYIRRVTSLEIEEIGNCRLRFTIKGNSFLYKMVRNSVGTLVYVGKGRIPLEDLPKIFSSQNRSLAGMTAPAHGLTLHRVTY